MKRIVLPSIEQQIDFLVLRKFPGSPVLKAIRATGKNMDSNYQLMEQDIENYKKTLCEMPANDRVKIYLVEHERNQEEITSKLRIEAEQKERGMFYNLPYAKADFAHWGKATYWSLDEAIALTFGKDPKHVTWEKVKEYTKSSPFAMNYEKLRDLAIRAKHWKHLSDYMEPGAYIAWARRNGFDFPQELEDNVKKNGGYIGDWKTAYDNLLAEAKQSLEKKNNEIAKLNQDLLDSQQNIAAKDGLVKNQATQIVQLTGQLAAQSEKPLKTRERETALKMILAMAIEGYGYDPKASKSGTATEIADDLAKLGLNLDADTIRKWLKEAIELLPPQETQD